MADKQNVSNDEAAVRDLIEAWADAVRRRGLCWNPPKPCARFRDVRCSPAVQKRRARRVQKNLGPVFFLVSGPARFDIQEMGVTAGADVAFAFATMGCEEPGADGKPEPLNFRLTIGLRKVDGQWVIAHEHHSVPAVD